MSRGYQDENGKSITSIIQVSDKKSTFESNVDLKPDTIVLDLNLWLLFEEKQ